MRPGGRDGSVEVVHPVAFTCPLWWVARWATRVLASLVVLSFALGATPAPLPASTAAALPSTSESPALPGWLAPTTAVSITVTADRSSAAQAARRAVADWATPGRATDDTATESTAVESTVTEDTAAENTAALRRADASSARSADAQPVLHGAPGGLPGPPTAVVSVRTGSERSPRAAGSATRAPRAPPA
jgi:hypothetical protein